MTRRRLFKLVALTLAGVSLPLTWLAHRRADVLFDGLFGDVSLAAKVGRAHGAKDPMAGTRGRALLAHLSAGSGPVTRQSLRERAEADLAALDVVVADGWVLARSEADLCAAVDQDRRLA